MKTNANEKSRILGEIGDMVSKNSILMVRSGTMSLYIPEGLRKTGSITILTNAIYFSQRFEGTGNPNIILLEGIANPKDQLTYEDGTIYQLNRDIRLIHLYFILMALIVMIVLLHITILIQKQTGK